MKAKLTAVRILMVEGLVFERILLRLLFVKGFTHKKLHEHLEELEEWHFLINTNWAARFLQAISKTVYPAEFTKKFQVMVKLF